MGEGVIAEEDSTSAQEDAMAARDLVDSRNEGNRGEGAAVRFQTSQDKIIGSNSFAHVASSGTAVNAEAFEKAAMTSPAILAR